MAGHAGADRTSSRDRLARHGLRAKKAWGQNFLVDRAVQDRIVAAAGAGPDDVVVEIGAGLGALTTGLAERARRVIAIERDRELAGALTAELGPHGKVEVIETDAQTFDLGACARAAGRALIVVGNLPYQITSPLLFKVIEDAAGGRVVARAVVMVQREFAERMQAPPGDKTYGRLSVMVQQAADVQILFHVGARSFHPRPKVTSSVVRVTPRSAPRAPVRDRAVFAAVVRAAFGTRRKMLRRALAPAFGDDGSARGLAAAGIDGTRRAETLAIAEFARLADALTDDARVPVSASWPTPR